MCNLYYNAYDACGHNGPYEPGRRCPRYPRCTKNPVETPTSGLCPGCQQGMRAGVPLAGQGTLERQQVPTGRPEATALTGQERP